MAGQFEDATTEMVDFRKEALRGHPMIPGPEVHGFDPAGQEVFHDWLLVTDLKGVEEGADPIWETVEDRRRELSKSFQEDAEVAPPPVDDL